VHSSCATNQNRENHLVLYRRNYVIGGTYFFTVTLRDRSATLLCDHIDLLRQAYEKTVRQQPFTTDAIVILPEHLHAIWTLPQGDMDYSSRWRAIKAMFSRSLRQAGVEPNRNSRGEATVWQRRFWEHTVRDDLDFVRHVNYIHWNPVKHGHALTPADWPNSTFHRFVKDGRLAANWGGKDIDGDFGES